MKITKKQKEDMIKMNRTEMEVIKAQYATMNEILGGVLPEGITQEMVDEVAIYGAIVGSHDGSKQWFLLRYPDMPVGEGWRELDLIDGTHVVEPPKGSALEKLLGLMVEHNNRTLAARGDV